VRKNCQSHIAIFKKVALWGTGGLGSQVISNWLSPNSFVTVVDSNLDKMNSQFFGKEIASPDSIIDNNVDCVVVATSAFKEVSDTLKNLNFNGSVINAYSLLVPNEKTYFSELDKLHIDILVQKTGNWFSFFLNRPQIWSNITYRLCRHSSNKTFLKVFLPFLKIWHSLTTMLLSISLPIDVEAGPGLSFAHYGTIVIRAGVKIGAFCTIYHNCTLGSDENGGKPLLEDFVTVYTGSTLIGDCRIGSYTRVGAHSLLLALSTPGNCTVAGTPGRIIKYHLKTEH
jgi:serine O-acetyltransferase